MKYYQIYESLLKETCTDEMWQTHGLKHARAALFLFELKDWDLLEQEWKEKSDTWKERCARTLGTVWNPLGYSILWDMLGSQKEDIIFRAIEAIRFYYYFTDFQIDFPKLETLKLTIHSNAIFKFRKDDILTQISLISTQKPYNLVSPYQLSKEEASNKLFQKPEFREAAKKSLPNIPELNRLPLWAQEKLLLLTDNDEFKIRFELFESRSPSLRGKSIWELFQTSTITEFEDIVSKHLSKLIDWSCK